MRKMKTERGVTLVALTITVIILLIVSSILIYNANDNIQIKRLTSMYNDVSNLRDKVASYYKEYGAIPAKIEYTAVSHLKDAGVIGANDGDKFYVLDLERLDGVTLNFGKDYEKVRKQQYTDINQLKDLYIINEKSHNIFYSEGIQVKDNDTIKIFYTDDENIDKVEVPIFKKGPINPGQEVEGVTFSTDYGTIDVIWLDKDNNIISKPNAPELTSNGESLIPIKWDESNNIVETKQDDTNWYDYATNRWANAKTKNESLFVWIPRYAYRITYYSDPEYKNVTGYYDGYGQWNAETKEIRLLLDEGIETVDYNGEKYIVHPAFETNLENGGWDKELEGIWVAKFEANGIGKDLKFTYGVQSVRSQTIGMQYTSARQATYGYIGQKGEDGNTSFMNSHMMKNSEWGAVAYLTHSKYGLNGKEIKANNSSSYYTGGGIGEEYKSNTNESTTGNVYGIYDLSGGAWERISTFNSTDINEDFIYFQWTEATGLTTDSESTKYATKYYNETDLDSGNKITYKVGKVGDATKEVNTGGRADKNDTKSFNNWFSDYPYFVYSTSPFFGRGGTYTNGDGAGIFYMDHVMGTSHNISFRASLAF